jgi:hypothetical protein
MEHAHPIRRRLAALAAVAAIASAAIGIVVPRSARAAPDVSRGQARVLVDQAAGLASTISGWQSQGGTPTVARTGADQWTIHLGGLTGLGGNVQLTQYVDTGATMDRAGYCTIESWSPDATGQSVRIGCWADDGSPATDFAVGILFDNATTFPNDGAYAAFWQGSGNWAGAIAPNPIYQMHLTPRLTRTSPGHYTVEYLAFSTSPFPLATAWSTVPRVCNIVDWVTGRSTISPHELGQFFHVACFDFAGKPADTGFSFLVTDRSPLGLQGTVGGRLVTTAAPIGALVTPSTGNVNTTSGVSQATNSFRNVTGPGPASTRIDVPGYPGPFGFLTGADTLESLGDDGARCFLENAPVQTGGLAELLAFCKLGGSWVIHALHAGTWRLG